MKTQTLTLMLLVAATLTASAQQHHVDWRGRSRRFTVKADRIAVDNVTKAATATGNVEAVCGPVRLHSACATRSPDGTVHLHAPSDLTTCTNHPGVCHWALKGDVTYQNEKYVCGRNMTLEFCELPIFWLPYFYYPLDRDSSVRIMPGYTHRWGAYVMSKCLYDFCGDPEHGVDTLWLHGNTRFDLRYENGIAAGQSLEWGLGRLGQGKFKVYYAWDEDHDHYDRYWSSDRNWNYRNWGSTVDYNRYRLELEHALDVTERDIVRVTGSVDSDSHMTSDFFRNSAWVIDNVWQSVNRNEVAWEHNENAFGGGVSVSGPINRFYGGTARLPEAYFDVMPQSVFCLPINYESQTRAGYLTRQYAEYGDSDRENPFQFAPGLWAEYETFRLDTYHRLTAPFKVGDVLSVVPRLAYRGTFWHNAGETELTGWEEAARSHGTLLRSILEGGVTFAGRGTAWLDDRWRHMVEPYLDVLAQKAWYDGLGANGRPYMFDSLDASVDWQDQFAGRSRKLPYTYCGVTPGLRNAFSQLDEQGFLRTVFDFDLYASLQFMPAKWDGTDDNHKLAYPDRPNYGKDSVYAAPGFRLRWFPADDIQLRAQLEYDPDYNTIPFGDLEWRHKPWKKTSYYVRYAVRDYRRWDYSSTPYDPDQMSDDDLNRTLYNFVDVGFENEPISWFAWCPFIRWDCRAGEMDSVGAWFDYLTDCLGFRLIVEYQNDFMRIDGSRRDDDVYVGFMVYLRALGAEATDIRRW